uniref:Reticulon-like protein n=1 Tax=Hydatigena taeniaeformis TaxID=6205 RepID=A0A0R3WKU7_HYDTA
LLMQHFDDLCFRRNLLQQTTSEYLEVLVGNKQAESVSEEAKFRAISKWLDLGFDMCDLEERAKEFTKLITKIDLTELSPQFLTEFWKLGEGICRIALCRDVLLAYGWNKTSRCWMLTSVPQLQPEESINYSIPFNGEAAVSDGRFYVLGGVGTKTNLLTLNFRDGSNSTTPVQMDPRSDYSIMWSNDSIFIFGGHYRGQCLSTCEKLDTTNGELTKLPDIPNARHGMSIVSTPDFGIVAVGGSDRVDSNLPTSRNADMMVEDDANTGGWHWTKLSPMLKERYRPGIASFNQCVVVAGGDAEYTVESLSLTSNAQWTLLRGIDNYFSSWDLRLSPATSSHLAQIMTTRINKLIHATMDLFLLRHIGNSARFGVLLYGLTYIGARFNFLTLCIWGER